MALSDDFLMHAAMGTECIVYDYGANKAVPRAVWQGLEWIKFALSARWYQQAYSPQGRAVSCRNYFVAQCRVLDKHTKTRLNYFKRYLNGPLRISSVTSATKHDGNYAHYINLLQQPYVKLTYRQTESTMLLQ